MSKKDSDSTSSGTRNSGGTDADSADSAKNRLIPAAAKCADTSAGTSLRSASAGAAACSHGYQPGTVGAGASKVGAAPPWEQARTVYQCEPTRLFSQLKSRLSPIVTASRHTRQRLYKDQQTGQHWLSLIVAIRRLDERLEILKPVSSDVAESLYSSPDQMIGCCLPK